MQTVPPIRYLNLDRDVERRARLAGGLARLGLSAERFSALLWSAIPHSGQEQLYSAELNRRQYHRPLVDGEKGCYASHLALWRWLLDSTHESVVVLEDDVRPKPTLATVCAAVAQLPAGWDLIKLLGRAVQGRPEKPAARRPLCTGHDLVDYRRVPSFAAAYVVSRNGAAKLLRTRIPFGRPVDVDLRYWWEGAGLHVQGVSPDVIELDETSLTSSIGAKAGEVGLRARLRKARYKLHYSVANALHRPR